MRALVTLATGLFLAMLLPSAAQQPSPKKQETRTGTYARDGANKPALSQSEKEAAAAKARNEARERTWDERMKRTMRSICSGATGC
jgi:hypothetical protein